MRFLAAAIAVLALGCNQVFGLDEPLAGPRLRSLTPSRGELAPPFAPSARAYVAAQSVLAREVRLIAEVDPGLTLTLDGVGFEPGVPSPPIPLALDERRTVAVAVSDGVDTTTYTVELTRGGAPPAYTRVTAPAPATGERFGAAVAIDGDRLVVGAPLASPRGAAENCDQIATSVELGFDTGVVHVFARDGAGWSDRGQLAPPAETRCGTFGSALALRGGRLVVGSPTETGIVAAVPIRNAGAVYAYRAGAGDTWVTEVLPPPPTPTAGARLGASLAVDDALLVVGSPGAPNGPSLGAGAVYLYPTATTATVLRGATTDAGFGTGLALGDSDLLIGSPGADTGGLDSGEVAIYARGTTVPTQTITVAEPGGGFGAALARHGELTVVGAPGAAMDTGAVWLMPQSSAMNAGTRAAAATGDAGDRHGASVAFIGDLIAVGVCGDDRAQRGWSATDVDDDTVDDAGAVYLYRASAAAAVLVGVLAAPDPVKGGGFGCALAAGADELVIGAPGATVADQRGAGEVWLVR